MPDIVCQVSGGVDSAAALCVAVKSGRSVIGHFIGYGQPYLAHEVAAASALCAKLGVDLIRSVASVRPVSVGDRPAAYFPLRNLVLGATSLSLAASLRAPEVWVGNKTIARRPGDPYSFRDCTPEFYAALSAAALEGADPGEAPKIVMPVSGWSKAAAIQEIEASGVRLLDLWWCYGSGPSPCGSCRHCRDVAEAACAC